MTDGFLAPEEIVERIWARDPMLWTGRDEGRWLGWLDEPRRGEQEVETLAELVDGVAGLTDDIVLLGMGG